MLASFLVAYTCIIAASALPAVEKGVSQAIFDDLVFYFKYASNAYSDVCPHPNGNVLIKQLSESSTDTQGYVSRDDKRKEVVIALRGSTSIIDFLTDADFILSPYASPGVSAPDGALVHSGFLEAYNSVADSIISTVRGELHLHPGYSLVTTGHSLGAALASLTAASLKGNFPSVPIRMYTYGQPRTGNAIYADWINKLFGANSFRAVHTADNIPAIPPTWFGYAHHGYEYWTYHEPPSAENTRRCAADGEDPTCSAQLSHSLLPLIDNEHRVYYGIYEKTQFC